LSLSIVLLVISTSRGYENELLKNVKSAEPDISITSKIHDFISLEDYNEIKNKLNVIDSTITLAPYFKNYSMIKNSNSSYGVSTIALQSQKINDFYNISINDDNYTLQEGEIYINGEIEKQLNSADLKKIILFDLEGMVEDSKIKAKSFTLKNTFEAELPVFDNTVFISMNDYRELFSVEKKYTGIFINNTNEKFIQKLNDSNIILNYNVEHWDDKYQNLLFWLTIFTNPLYLILSFIVFLAIIYQMFANWLLFTDKHSSFMHLKTLGVSNKNISVVSFGISVTILFISLLSGSIITLFLSFLQNNYNIIKVDSSIYILSYLYSEIEFYDFLYLFLITMVTTLVSTKIIISKKIKQFNGLKIS